jgi:Helix-turn-helix of DDE superfamily endonuclease
MDYKTLHRNSKQFRSVSGLKHTDFVILHRYFATVWKTETESFTVSGKRRKRKRTERIDGCFPSSEDRLLFIVSYLKNNPTQEYHASQWGMYQGQANAWIQYLLKILRQALLSAHAMPARSAEELMTMLEAKEQRTGEPNRVRIDGTERPIERPQAAREQRKRYSGKKNATRSKTLS